MEKRAGWLVDCRRGVTLEQLLERVERQLVESTLRRWGHHKDRAAKRLGLARSSLFERLKKWGHGEQQEPTRWTTPPAT